VLSEVGSLVWFRINSVPAGAVIYAAMAPMFVMGSRGLAMAYPRAGKWASIGFILIVLLRLFGANSVTVLRDFVWLFDLGAVALLLLFCFWPSKSEPQMAQSQ
jgi:hypothetical protein